ncbi:hypothetical protein QE152_g5402 [Popillia japonica]|uniref:Uncharacterized protein n=1 Tax=Popillia japonica TaxID=7064 RepID=A0AAW1MP51_POPJA
MLLKSAAAFENRVLRSIQNIAPRIFGCVRKRPTFNSSSGDLSTHRYSLRKKRREQDKAQAHMYVLLLEALWQQLISAETRPSGATTTGFSSRKVRILYYQQCGDG